MSSTAPRVLDSGLVGRLPRHPVFEPDFQGRREQVGVVHRCRGDIDGRRARDTFVRELAATSAAKLANDTLGRLIGARAARQKFHLSAVERQPCNHWSGARSAACSAVANAGENRLPGNAKPNCRTETTTIMNLHGSSNAGVGGQGPRTTSLHGRSYQDAAAANTDRSESGNGARDYGPASRPRILTAHA